MERGCCDTLSEGEGLSIRTVGRLILYQLKICHYPVRLFDDYRIAHGPISNQLV